MDRICRLLLKRIIILMGLRREQSGTMTYECSIKKEVIPFVGWRRALKSSESSGLQLTVIRLTTCIK